MPPPAAQTAPFPPVLLEGHGWFVIDKPAGLAVHPGPATPHSLEQLLAARTPGRPPPSPVHRLDRDTSGCLLVATRASAHRRLALAFAAGQVEKTYRAIVCNPPAAAAGTIDAALAKISSMEAGWRMIASAGGKAARTRWRVLARAGDSALVEFRPETGRTHQIRVHATLLAQGAAIRGDPVYGRGEAGGLMLHAYGLDFPGPAGDGRHRAVAALPSRFGWPGFDTDGAA